MFAAKVVTKNFSAVGSDLLIFSLLSTSLFLYFFSLSVFPPLPPSFSLSLRSTYLSWSYTHTTNVTDAPSCWRMYLFCVYTCDGKCHAVFFLSSLHIRSLLKRSQVLFSSILVGKYRDFSIFSCNSLRLIVKNVTKFETNHMEWG